MRQFDIVALTDKSLAIILQADLPDSTTPRVVAPLVRDATIRPVGRLHPEFGIGRHTYALLADKLGAVMASDIAPVIGSARDRDYDSRRARDIIFTGV